MKSKIYLVVLVVFLSALALQTAQAFTVGAYTRIYEGVEYATAHVTSPREMRAWAFRVSLQNPDISCFTTVDNGTGAKETWARTTEHFLDDNNLEIATNCSFTDPGVPENGADDIWGAWMHDGTVVSQPNAAPFNSMITLTSSKVADIYVGSSIPGGNYNVIAGAEKLLANGVIVIGAGTLNPNTGLGLSQDKKYMIMVIVDGRQPGWSEGCYVNEMAQWMLDFGAWDALKMDGGGSSCIVKSIGVNGAPDVLNQPSDGAPRPVGCNVGFNSVAAGTVGPAATSWGTDRMDVVSRGPLNHVRIKTWTASGSWQTDWTDLGGSTTLAPAITSRAPGLLSVFESHSDNHLYHRAFDGTSWGNWEDLGGDLTAHPAADSWGSDRVNVVVRGIDSNTLYLKTWSSSVGWSNYVNIGYPGTRASTAPAVVSRGYNLINVYVRSSDNATIYQRASSDGGVTWGSWTSRGGTAASAPAACSWGIDREDVVYRGSNEHIYWRKWSSPGGWAASWTDLGGNAISEPGIVSRDVNCVEIFYRSYNDHFYHKYTTNGGSTWSGWIDAGAYF